MGSSNSSAAYSRAAYSSDGLAQPIGDEKIAKLKNAASVAAAGMGREAELRWREQLLTEKKRAPAEIPEHALGRNRILYFDFAKSREGNQGGRSAWQANLNEAHALPLAEGGRPSPNVFEINAMARRPAILPRKAAPNAAEDALTEKARPSGALGADVKAPSIKSSDAPVTEQRRQCKAMVEYDLGRSIEEYARLLRAKEKFRNRNFGNKGSRSKREAFSDYVVAHVQHNFIRFFLLDAAKWDFMRTAKYRGLLQNEESIRAHFRENSRKWIDLANDKKGALVDIHNRLAQELNTGLHIGDARQFYVPPDISALERTVRALRKPAWMWARMAAGLALGAAGIATGSIWAFAGAAAIGAAGRFIGATGAYDKLRYSLTSAFGGGAEKWSRRLGIFGKKTDESYSLAQQVLYNAGAHNIGKATDKLFSKSGGKSADELVLSMDASLVDSARDYGRHRVVKYSLAALAVALPFGIRPVLEYFAGGAIGATSKIGQVFSSAKKAALSLFHEGAHIDSLAASKVAGAAPSARISVQQPIEPQAPAKTMPSSSSNAAGHPSVPKMAEQPLQKAGQMPKPGQHGMKAPTEQPLQEAVGKAAPNAHVKGIAAMAGPGEFVLEQGQGVSHACRGFMEQKISGLSELKHLPKEARLSIRRALIYRMGGYVQAAPGAFGLASHDIVGSSKARGMLLRVGAKISFSEGTWEQALRELPKNFKDMLLLQDDGARFLRRPGAKAAAAAMSAAAKVRVAA